MKFIIIGTGGIGAFYGAKLTESGHDVFFVARGEHLNALRQNGLTLLHAGHRFSSPVNVAALAEVSPQELIAFDAVILSTKSNSTENIAKELADKLVSIQKEDFPFFLSLQNGVENEDILCNYLPEEKVIGGLSRKIGAHIVNPGVIEATGNAETFIGAIKSSNEAESFLKAFKDILTGINLFCEISDNIKSDLWKKLIINNGVNAICALLRIETGELMSHDKLSRIVLGLMQETAVAAKAANIIFSKEDVIQMHDLITNFDSIKPSMLVDVENNRPIELDEICNIVIKNCELQNIDAPYTRTISSLLAYTYLEN